MKRAVIARCIHGLSATALATLVFALLLLVSVRAEAQSDNFYLDRAQLSGAPDDGFMVFRPYVSEQTRFYGTGALGFSLNPLRKNTVTDDAAVRRRIDNLVQAQFITYLMAGAQIKQLATFSLSLPVAVYQLTGDDPAGEGVGGGGLSDNPVAAHDARLDARLRYHQSADRKLRLGAGAAFFVPTGNAEGFAGDGQVTGWLFANGELDFGRFFGVGMLGPHFRPQRSIGGDAGDLFLASELRYAIGAYMPIRGGTVRLGAELWGQVGIGESGGESTFFTGKNTQLEWLAQARFLFDADDRMYANLGAGTRLAPGYGGADLRVLGSIGYYLTLEDTRPKAPARKIEIIPDADDYDRDTDGDGYPDSVDKCPTIKEDGKPPDPTDGCPIDADRDGDGIPDTQDQCPDEPEDKDGVEDKDGCPEEDVDNDGIPDGEDRCPTEPGPRSSDAEKNGCPQLTRIDPDGSVTLLEPIQFEYNKATIKPVSFPILDEVVTLMKSRPSLRIGVYGHTDSQGGHDYNVRLSKNRAASVMRYLVSAGVAANRLESEGFGPDKPLASNDTEQGRAKNRRVEFKILGD